MEAPTFTSARRELYTQLSRYTFGKVVRCTVPPDGQTRVGDQVTVTFFHGLATKMEHRQQLPGSRPVKLWFKKAPPEAARSTLSVGPLQLDAAQESYVPRPGDVLMGNVVPSDGPRRAPAAVPGGSGTGLESNDRFTFWYPHAACLEALLNYLFHGTAVPEAQLAHELRSRRKGGEDDVWAVARLILFGNVRAFAEQHLGSSGAKPMRLSVPPLHFVWQCATKLDDDSIWDKFVELVPDAQPPLEMEQPEAAKPTPLVIPPLFAAGDEPSSRDPAFVGRTRRGRSDRPSQFGGPSSSFAPPPPPAATFGSAAYSHHDAYSPEEPGYFKPTPVSQPYGSYAPQSPPHYSSPSHYSSQPPPSASPFMSYGSYVPQSPPHPSSSASSSASAHAASSAPPPVNTFFHNSPYQPRSPLYSPSNSPPYCPTTPPNEFADDGPVPPVVAGAGSAPAMDVTADSVLKLLQRVSSIQGGNASPPPPVLPPAQPPLYERAAPRGRSTRSFSPPRD